jgi:uncharacterized protein (DUF58 family)
MPLIPHRNLLVALAAWLALAAAAAALPPALPLWTGAGLLLLALASADALAARALGNPLQVTRELQAALPVGGWQEVGLRLAGERAARGWLFDHHPPGLPGERLPLRFRLRAGEWQRLAYRLRLAERGVHRFGRVELRLESPMRLWLARHFAGEPAQVRVYPDFSRITQYALLAIDNRLSQIGLLQRRRRGQGLEFHQLRDYREDDSPRQIDWKASARARRLIAREYQDERDQQIVFLLDCGNRMRAKDGELSHFDHTLNAMLLLAYVALRQGDAAGVATFGHGAPRFLPPRKSVATVNVILNAVFDLQPTLSPPDYLEAVQRLGERLRKRSLVILLTNLRDEDEDTLGPALKFLRRRHEVTLASLREALLEALRLRAVADFEDALTYASALDYQRGRERQIARLRGSGIGIVDVPPPQLPMALVNHYWERKRAGML